MDDHDTPVPTYLQGIHGDYEFYPIPIGYGSFSILYKGWSKANLMPVAIKKITRIIHQDYFDNEIRLMQELNHPNILKLYDVIQQPNEHYLILEYCEGGELKDYLSRPESQRTHDMDYFNQLINGLEYLHLHSIAHRDIKPQNILIHHHTLKISDFGFAKLFHQDELIKTYCGTPLYMAPEILKNEEYDAKSDVWSVGVILYELFARKHPYTVRHKKELVRLMSCDEIPIEYTTPPFTEDAPVDLIRQCLLMDPSQRIGWRELFKQAHHAYSAYVLKVKRPAVALREESSASSRPRSCSMPMSNNIEIPKPKPMTGSTMGMTMRKALAGDSPIVSPTSSPTLTFSPSPSLTSSIVDNYIRTREASIERDKPQIMLIGQSPTLKAVGFTNCLDRSYRTIKNILKFNL